MHDTGIAGNKHIDPMQKCLQTRYRCATTDRRLPKHQDSSPQRCTHNRALRPKQVFRQPQADHSAPREFWGEELREAQAEAAPANPELDMFGTAWHYLEEENQAHLKEIGKVCCKRRQPRTRFRIGRIPHQSMYHEDFGPKRTELVSKFVPEDNLALPAERAPLNTISRLDYTPKVADTPLLRPKDNSSFQGPLPKNSFYGAEYQDWGNCQREVILNEEAINLRGLPFNANSTARTSFLPKPLSLRPNCKPKDQCLYGKTVPMRTTYGQMFNYKQKLPVFPSLPVQAINNPKAPIDFGTTYRGDFVKPGPLVNLNKCHYSRLEVQMN